MGNVRDNLKLCEFNARNEQKIRENGDNLEGTRGWSVKCGQRALHQTHVRAKETAENLNTHVLHYSIGNCIQLYAQCISLISFAFGIPGESLGT